VVQQHARMRAREDLQRGKWVWSVVFARTERPAGEDRDGRGVSQDVVSAQHTAGHMVALYAIADERSSQREDSLRRTSTTWDMNLSTRQNR
jgi:hypothetical protein